MAVTKATIKLLFETKMQNLIKLTGIVEEELKGNEGLDIFQQDAMRTAIGETRMALRMKSVKQFSDLLEDPSSQLEDITMFWDILHGKLEVLLTKLAAAKEVPPGQPEDTLSESLSKVQLREEKDSEAVKQRVLLRQEQSRLRVQKQAEAAAAKRAAKK